jgi:environmental stress-induced protein Ves
MPWRNGRGTTLELARSPAEGAAFEWRLSAADVASDGLFSPFPGCERVLVLLEGAGIELLRADGRMTRLAQPFETVRFSGDEPIDSRLVAGPIRDFNAIVDRTRFAVELAVVRAAGRAAAACELATGGAELLVYAFDGDAHVDGVEVAAGRLLHAAPAPPRSRVATTGVALAVVLRPR